MALASLDDVKRVLRFTDSDPQRDAQLQADLDAVESWAEMHLWRLSQIGAQVETYFDIPEDATLHLPAADVTVTLVKAFEHPSSVGVPLSAIELGLGHGYDISADGKLILRPILTVSPFEGATAQRRMRTYARVEVHYQGTGVIPQAVTEGIAFLAAGYWQDGPRALSGLRSEKIGDYSYSLGGGSSSSVSEDTPSFVTRALWLLTPFLKRQRVSVT